MMTRNRIVFGLRDLIYLVYVLPFFGSIYAEYVLLDTH